MQKELWKGNEAIAEAAVRAGCRAYFGYPITPQNEIPEYMSVRMPEAGGVFVQAESEIAAINMVYGAAAAGVRAMTSSSSPGISLKQEGISYLIGAELPAVIVNMMRGGPGLGTIQAGQADYFQATRSPGHGDGRMIVLAPSGIQEAADLVAEAFDLADIYRNPVMILADGMIGQMMEPIVWHERKPAELPPKDWAALGREGDGRTHFVTSLRLQSAENEVFNQQLMGKYQQIARDEVRWEAIDCQDAQIIIVAYGTTARICQSAARKLKQEGIRVGVFRPIGLWPYPYEALRKLAEQDTVRSVLTVEMSLGQMVEDVRLAVCGVKPTPFYGRTGGMIPETEQVADQVHQILREVKA
ncbi:MAG: 3-methyl-2-oxobutanoate dehydrogenase subunit VorB [Eubacteriales bacterium]|nr:3-methyl-2-oxobutanoate dehydrogenase subunit VorB [Eubacteriales bacterium]